MSENEIVTQEHSSEARLLAALSHASVVAEGLGVLVGVIVYVTQREKSKYAAFQALQAAIFQLIGVGAMITCWVCWTIGFSVALIPMTSVPTPADQTPAGFWILMGTMLIPFAVMGVWALYGLWGAVRTWQGKDFRYIGIGAALERTGLWNGEE
jgi:uncharacterized Tic20 family protein